MDSSAKSNKGKLQRRGMYLPLVLLIASLTAGCLSYSKAKRDIVSDLNRAMIVLANENSELWTKPDTISALRQITQTTKMPLIVKGTDLDFANTRLRDEAYYTIALADIGDLAHNSKACKIASDSIFLVPENADAGLVVHLQGFADCSMDSVFAISDQKFSGILLLLSVLSMTSMLLWRRNNKNLSERAGPSLSGIKLTPMQRQLIRMLEEAEDGRVDKTTLCDTLWGGKTNAEESLYTLVRRTKAAIAGTRYEIVCNRGESYELRITH